MLEVFKNHVRGARGITVPAFLRVFPQGLKPFRLQLNVGAGRSDPRALDVGVEAPTPALDVGADAPAPTLHFGAETPTR